MTTVEKIVYGSLKLNFVLLQATSRPFLPSQGAPTTGCQASERLHIDIDSSVADAPLGQFLQWKQNWGFVPLPQVINT